MLRMTAFLLKKCSCRKVLLRNLRSIKIIAYLCTAKPQGVVLEWLKRHAWKACIRQKRIGGSNPPHSAKQAGFTSSRYETRLSYTVSTKAPLIHQSHRHRNQSQNPIRHHRRLP